MRHEPAWAEQTRVNAQGEGDWYVWFSDEPLRRPRRLVHVFTGGSLRHPSPSANENEEAAKKLATTINNAYWLGRRDGVESEDLFRSGAYRRHIETQHPDGKCPCHPSVVRAEVPMRSVCEEGWKFA